MKTLEWRTVDKSSWLDGPWKDEPDKKQWQDSATGYPCLIVRGPSGALCGYVGVAQNHPAFEKDTNEVDVSIHGGPTFSDFCQPHPEGDFSEHICHNVESGENDRVWWIGFDCAHSGDIMPSNKYGLNFSIQGSEYRDFAYVTSEVESLAQQLKVLENA